MFRIRLLAALLVFLLSPAAGAANLNLGELIRRFEDAGYRFVYSTALVDVAAVVTWDGEVSRQSLGEVLATLNLSLERIDGGRLAIQAKDLSSEGDQPGLAVGPYTRPIDHIVVTASRYELQGGDVARGHLVSATELDTNPSFGGDSLRIVHRLPGAASIGVTSKPNVRGGNDDELLVLFDGVELVEPFHLRDFQSMFSSFNPQTIESMEFFTGGFPARYGNRMSGVLDIATQDSFEAPGGELGISAYNLSALYFDESENDQYLVSARRGNLDLVLKSENGDPRYHDLYGRYMRRYASGELTISAFVFDDDLRFVDDESEVTSNVENRYVWLEWEGGSGNRHARTLLSIGHIDSERDGWTFSPEDSEGLLRDASEFRTINLAHSEQWQLGDRWLIDFGATWREQSIDYSTRVEVTKDLIAAFLGQPGEVSLTYDDEFDGASVSVYGAVKFKPVDRVSLDLGLRWDRQTFGFSDSQFSPRIAVLYQPMENWDLRFSYGRFHQPHAIHELNTVDGETAFFKPQRADHYIFASEYRVNERSRLTAELFYKQIDNLKPRYINLFDPYVYLPELQQDRITVTAQEAEARGFELTWAGTNRSEAFAWNLNYTWSEVQDREQGRWIDRRWDQTHTVNGMFTWYLGNWTLSLAAAWHTGWATTRLPLSLPADETLSIPVYRNNDRLKDYATLDARIAYDHQLPASTLRFFLEVTNLVNRANKGGVDYEIGLEDDAYELEEFDVQPVFPAVTNLGVVWRF